MLCQLYSQVTSQDVYCSYHVTIVLCKPSGKEGAGRLHWFILQDMLTCDMQSRVDCSTICRGDTWYFDGKLQDM